MTIEEHLRDAQASLDAALRRATTQRDRLLERALTTPSSELRAARRRLADLDELRSQVAEVIRSADQL